MVNIFKCCFGFSKKRSKSDRSRKGDDKSTIEIDPEKIEPMDCPAAPSHQPGDRIVETEASCIHSTMDESFQLKCDRWTISEDLASINIRMKPDISNGEQISDLLYVTGVMALYHTERTHIRSLKSLRDRCMKRLEQLDSVSCNEIQKIMSSMHNLIRFHENIKNSLREAIDYDNEQPLVGQILLIHLTNGGEACIPSECFLIQDNRDRVLSLLEEEEITLEFREDDPLTRSVHPQAVLKDFVDTVISRINNYCVMIEEILRHTNDPEESNYLTMCIEAAENICLRLKRRQAKNEMREQMSQNVIRLFNDSMSMIDMSVKSVKCSSHNTDTAGDNLESRKESNETHQHGHAHGTVPVDGPIYCKQLMKDYLPIEKSAWNSCWALLHQTGYVFLCKSAPGKTTDFPVLRIGSSDGYQVVETVDDHTKRNVIGLQSISAGHQILLGFPNETVYVSWLAELVNMVEGLEKIPTNGNSACVPEESRINKKKLRSPFNISLGSESFRLGQLPSCNRHKRNNLKVADITDNDKPDAEFCSSLQPSESQGNRCLPNSSQVINDTSINHDVRYCQDDCDGNSTVEIDLENRPRSNETPNIPTVPGYRPDDRVVETEACCIRSTIDESFRLKYDHWSIPGDLASFDIRGKPDMPKGEHEADLMYVLCVMELHNTERKHVGTLKYLRDKCIKCLEKLDPMVITEIEMIVSSTHNLIRFHENIEKSMREISENEHQQSLVGRILLIHLTDGGIACIPSECFQILDNRDRILSLLEENEITSEFRKNDSSIKHIHSDSIMKEFVSRVVSQISNYCVMFGEISRYTGRLLLHIYSAADYVTKWLSKEHTRIDVQDNTVAVIGRPDCATTADCIAVSAHRR